MDPHGHLNRAVFALPLALSTWMLKALGGAARGPERHRGAQPTRSRKAVSSDVKHPLAANALCAAAPDVQAMHRELKAVLDSHEGSRHVFRYLAHFEERLGRRGLDALERVSVKYLRRALAQFEAIVTNWSSPRLADLRSRMAVALADRDSAGALWQTPLTISKAYAPNPMPMVTGPQPLGGAQARGDARSVEVEADISMSRFEAALGEWGAGPPRGTG